MPLHLKVNVKLTIRYVGILYGNAIQWSYIRSILATVGLYNQDTHYIDTLTPNDYI